MADYMNPFSSIDPSAFGVGHTALEMVAADQKAKQAQPFIDMARQQQMMQMQESQQKLQEFMSPQAQSARMSGFGAEQAKNQQMMDVSSSESAKRISDAKEAVARNPSLTKKAIAEAELAANTAHSAPASALINSIGGLGQQWQQEQQQYGDKIPVEFLQAKHAKEYNALIAQHQLQFPNDPLPPGLQKYSPDTETHALAAHYTSLHQQELAAKQKIADTQAAAHIAGANIAAKATVESQGLSQQGATGRVEMQLPSKEELASTKREEAITRAVSSDPYLKTLQFRLLTADPKDLPALRQEMDARIAQHRQTIEGAHSGPKQPASGAAIPGYTYKQNGPKGRGWYKD